MSLGRCYADRDGFIDRRIGEEIAVDTIDQRLTGPLSWR